MAQIETLVLPGFVGGLNRESDPMQVAADELAVATDVVLGLSGAVSRRPGHSALFTLAAGKEPQHMWVWRDVDGDKHYVLVGADGDIHHGTDPATATTEQATDWGSTINYRMYPVAAASLDNILYLATRRGDQDVWKFDGTTWTAITDHDLSGGGSEFPVCLALVATHSRMFAFNCRVATVPFYSRVYFSNAGEPEVWDAADFIDIDPDDGQEITAAVAFGEGILIFKDHSIHMLSGTDPDTFTVFNIDPRIGTVCPGSVVVDGGVVRFFDPDTGVWEFDGAQFTKIDDKISNYLLSGQSRPYSYKARAFMYKSAYYLSVPWDTDTTNSRTFVYDTRLKAWVEWTLGVAAAWVDEYRLYVGDPSVGATSPTVSRFGLVFNDGGTDYDAVMRTGWLAPSGGAVKHRTHRVDVAVSTVGAFDLNVKMLRNYSTSPYVEKVINLAPGGMIWGTGTWGESLWGSDVEQVFKRLNGWGKRWLTSAFEISMDAEDGEFQINRLAIHLSSLGSPRSMRSG